MAKANIPQRPIIIVLYDKEWVTLYQNEKNKIPKRYC
jgi:hypothetical protein